MKPRLHAAALAALAVFLIAGPAAAQSGPPAGEPGQHTLVFRSLEDPNVSSHPRECPFPSANLFLGATLWSIETDAGDSRVVNEAVHQIVLDAPRLQDGELIPDRPTRLPAP